MLVLLIFEFFELKFIPFTLTILDRLADTFVTAGKSELLGFKLLIELSFKVGHPLFGSRSDLLHLFLLFDSQPILESSQLRVSFVLRLGANLLLFLPLDLLPLFSLLLNVLLVLNH